RANAQAWAKARPAAPVLAAPDGAALDPEPTSPFPIATLPEFDAAARVRGECTATGLWFTAHPLDVLVEAGAFAGSTPARSLASQVGRRAAVVGMPCAYRRVETKSGGLMLFVTLADRGGLAECVLFPDTYRAFA